MAAANWQISAEEEEKSLSGARGWWQSWEICCWGAGAREEEVAGRTLLAFAGWSLGAWELSCERLGTAISE
jgi:hypothetical protein